MSKHNENPASSTEQLEERTQRDQEERSKQALSNQGSQDRTPSEAKSDHDREPGKPA